MLNSLFILFFIFFYCHFLVPQHAFNNYNNIQGSVDAVQGEGGLARFAQNKRPISETHNSLGRQII